MSTMPTSLTLKCTLWRTLSINGAENQLGIIFLSSGFLAFVHRIRERSRKIWKARRIEEVDDGWSPAQRILMAMPRIHPKSSKVSSALDDDAVAKKSFFWQEKNSLYLCNSSSSKRAWESSSLQCILSYFTSQLKRKSLQRRIEVTPASELCMQVHYFLWWQGRVIKRGKSWMLSTFWGGPLQQILFGLLPCPSTNNFMNWIFALMFSLLLLRREMFEKFGYF